MHTKRLKVLKRLAQDDYDGLAQDVEAGELVQRSLAELREVLREPLGAQVLVAERWPSHWRTPSAPICFRCSLILVPAATLSALKKVFTMSIAARVAIL